QAPEPTPDPHASKIASDDPRLRLRRAPGRMLRKGPAIVLFAALLAVIVLAFSFALQPQKVASTKPEASTTAGLQAPVIPEAIRGAAATSASSSPQASARASGQRVPVYPPELGAGGGRGRPTWSGSPGPSAARARFQLDDKATSAGILFDAKADVGT